MAQSISLKELRRRANLTRKQAVHRASRLQEYGNLKLNASKLGDYEEGDERPPIQVAKALLRVFEVSPAEQEHFLSGFYALARRLRGIASNKGLTLKHLASRSSLSYYHLTRIFSGARLVPSPKRLLEIAEALGVDEGEKQELLRLAGFNTLDLEIGGADHSHLARNLLEELKKGVGPLRPRTGERFEISKGRAPEKSAWSDELIQKLVDEILPDPKLGKASEPIRISRADVDPGASARLFRRLQSLLESGVSVQLLVPVSQEPEEAITRILRSLAFLRQKGQFELRWVDPVEHAGPLSMVIPPEAPVWLLLPSKRPGIPYKAVPVGDREESVEECREELIEHFETRFDEAPGLLRLFDSNEIDPETQERDPARLQRELATAEELPGPCLVVKRRVTSSMFPSEARRLSLEASSAPGPIRTTDPWRFERYSVSNMQKAAEREEGLRELEEETERRHRALMRKLAEEPVREIYLKNDLEEFLLTDAPSFPAGVRAGIIDNLITLLEKHDGYEIGLVSKGSLLQGPLFGVHSKDIVCISVWQPQGQAEYLIVEHPAVARVFRQYFLREWLDIPKKDRTRQDVIGWLGKIRDKL